MLTYKGGFMDATALDEAAFKSIARLPSRDVLNGQFAGVVASPLTGLVRGLGSMIQGLALQLGQIAEQGLVTGEAAAAGRDGASRRPRPRRAERRGAEPAEGEAPAEEPQAEAESRGSERRDDRDFKKDSTEEEG